jgi:hypothetical protein
MNSQSPKIPPYYQNLDGEDLHIWILGEYKHLDHNTKFIKHKYQLNNYENYDFRKEYSMSLIIILFHRAVLILQVFM